MSAGRYAAADGSFVKSARGALARGVALIAVAVVIGILLLEATDPPDSLVDPATVATNATAGDDSSSSAPPASDDPEAPGTTAEGGQPAFDPGSVSVLVANGSSVPGAAGRLSATIEEGGYSIAPPADTPEDVDASVVYFVEGFEEAATAIAASLSPAPSVAALPDPPPVSAGDLGDAEVVVVVAAELAESA
ncbi:MAG: LytR C-terminal domain-containing protein [Actinomycetota bacterium]|nr:LytR C-terminal domain-containing protein [Actinomycetota bacterium]